MKPLLSILAAVMLAPSAFASFHFMQIEQVIGSVDGNPAAQAIQLRMRSSGQNQVQNSQIRVWDAAGANPVLLLNISASVPVNTAGSRVLLATAAFTTAVQATTPGFAPDFTLANPIPVSYLAAGRLTFEADAGTIYWSLAWGGAAYTGSHTGVTQNDANGNFGPAFGQGLPTTGRQGLLFQGTFGAQSTTNAADYALSADPATVTKNSGTSYIISPPPEIGVEQPAGNGLADGLASVAFGGVAPGSNISKVFTIKNTGETDLTGLGIAIDGAHPDDYTVTANPMAPVTGPAGSTTFTVRFAPTATGTRTAALHIASNDADENPFDIGLTGTGLTAQESWRNTWFGTTSNSGDAADLFDFDQDGLVNLIEFAFGLNPTLGTSLQLPPGQRVTNDFVISFAQPAAVTGITYGAEWSTTLAPADWHAISDAGAGSQHLFSTPISGNGPLFMRLKVTSP
ncbi:MAG: choice-of-anchor D domain-containing protein [Prosthecobacter sp.]|nr:choice-of-anchor D domain-containing protein [Prosthecobacter sp.]